MSSISESSFGATLENAKKIFTIVSSYTNYQAPRPEDSLTEYQSLIVLCDKENTQVATYLSEYTMAVDKRTKGFSNDDKNNLKKLLSPIAKAVESQYDKTSKEYTTIASIVSRMRSQKIEKTPTNPTEDKKESISRSELSYGSRLQNFKDLITNLETFVDYKPVNSDLKPAKLKELVAELETLNSQVSATLSPLTIARSKRKDLFDDLKKRTLRIKANVSSIYGNSSVEFKQVKGIKV